MSNTKPQQQVPGAVIAVLGGGYAGLFAAHREDQAESRFMDPPCPRIANSGPGTRPSR